MDIEEHSSISVASSASEDRFDGGDGGDSERAITQIGPHSTRDQKLFVEVHLLDEGRSSSEGLEREFVGEVEEEEGEDDAERPEEALLQRLLLFSVWGCPLLLLLPSPLFPPTPPPLLLLLMSLVPGILPLPMFLLLPGPMALTSTVTRSEEEARPRVWTT